MLRRLRELSAADRRLLAAALGWVIAARAALAAPGNSFVAKQRVLDALARGLPRLPPRSAAASCWAATAASKRVPGTVCLPWALALRGLLLQSGRQCSLRIGVARGEHVPLAAHAWVECEGRSFSWGDAVENYTVLNGREGSV